MAYKKRRYNTKKNKTKKFNKYAYAKTDSKNQAKQIVQLNKKISNVYKAIRPELSKRHHTGSIELSSEKASVISFDTMLNIESTSSINDFFKGVYAKFIYFNFKFFFNSSNLDLTKGKTIRIVIFQNRSGIESVPIEGDLFLYGQSILSPFKEGINNNYKILFDKKYLISSDRDYLYKSFNFKKLMGYNRFHGASDASKYARGCIFVMFITTQVDKYSINYTSSLGYTDTN